MSGSKRILVTLSVILVLTAISYLTLEIPYSKNGADDHAAYTSEFLFGFSIPLVGAGAILLMGTHLVLRTKKRVVKKTNHQIPGV